MRDSGTPYNTDSYAMSLVRRMNDGKGYIIADVSTNQIKQTFSNYDMGEGSIIGFITADGRETLNISDKESVFTELSYFQESLEKEQSSGFSYEKYNGEEYLYIYNRFEDVDVTLSALIPKSTILAEVRGIRLLSIIFVTVSVIIAGFVVLQIGTGIASNVTSLNKSISKVAQGDLTTTIRTNRKDEFAVLSQGVNDMMQHMRRLIGDVQDVSSTVSISAEDLTDTASDLLIATRGISGAIDESGKGVLQQAEDTEQCLLQMTNLSDNINQLYNNTNEIEKIANDTQNVASEGLKIVDELSEKSKATSEITQDVIKKIQEFEVESKKIEKFVNLINNIAFQTNLLSLNASIEAARAGEYGRGFAVVADEIMKLAEQSASAASEIQNTVKDVSEQNRETVNTAEQAESIVESQTEALELTVGVFKNINKHINSLVSNLNDIILRLDTIETAKDGTLHAIENISAVTEETAASSEEVNASATEQIDSVERLQRAVVALEEDASRLNEAIKIFKI